MAYLAGIFDVWVFGPRRHFSGDAKKLAICLEKCKNGRKTSVDSVSCLNRRQFIRYLFV